MKIDNFSEYNEKINKKALLGLGAGVISLASIATINSTSKRLDKIHNKLDKVNKDMEKEVKEDSEKTIKVDNFSKDKISK